MAQFVWNKPVLTFYRERKPLPERKPFAVVQATKLIVNTSEKKTLDGSVEGFFELMGNLDYVSFKAGATDRYVICWFDDKEDNFIKAARRLSGVTFTPGMSFTIDERDKRTYNTTFNAEFGKLE